MKMIMLPVLIVSGCATAGGMAGDPNADAGFLVAARAAVEALKSEGAQAHPVGVDPRAIGRNALSVSGDSLVDSADLVSARAQMLRDAGIERGDIAIAEECAHVGGMGGLMIEPLTDEQERLLETCGTSFRGFTIGVSLPSEGPNGTRVYRVLAFGSDTELGWDVSVNQDGTIAGIRKIMDHVS